MALRRLIVVAGRVQGVGYRASCAAVARRLRLDGSVRNLEDGRVEVVAVGPSAQVDRLTEWCRLGPVLARVDQVTVRDEPTGDEAGQGGGFVVLG